MKGFRIGQRVRALMVVTENGGFPADTSLKSITDADGKIQGSFVHAAPGDTGIVEFIEPSDPEGAFFPQVRFDRTGTATRVRGAMTDHNVDKNGKQLYPEVEAV